MTELNKLIRPNILKLVPYSCARDEFKGDKGIFLDANENPFGTLNRYPDPYQKELKKTVSDFRGIPEEKIFLGNGSDEIIDLCFRIFCIPGKDKALLFPPTYGMYEVSASINDVEVIKVPLNDDFQIDIEKAKKQFPDQNLKLAFICSPNNPTGNAMKNEDVVFILENFRGIVVIDEAYIDFLGKQSFSSLVNQYQNLIVMQTFSKALGLAAARIGIAFTNPEIVTLFNRVKPPYNISTVNQKEALAVLRNRKRLESRVKSILKERERLKSAFLKLKIVEKVFPTDANFMLLKVTDANSLYNYLISKDIIVRNRHSVVMNCIRVTVGTKKENDELLKAMRTLPPTPSLKK